MHEIGNAAREAAMLINVSFLLFESLDCLPEALHHLQRARQILERNGLIQDATGTTLEDINKLQQAMKLGLSPNSLDALQSRIFPLDLQEELVDSTIAVMTTESEQRNAWRTKIEAFLRIMLQKKGPSRQNEVDFLASILDILDDKASSLTADHPYASAITSIRKSIIFKKDSNLDKKDSEAP